tara:strand:- start:33 stop:335 length:303 start_codon:yes stop_codon:yes gene_type:complete
MKIQISLNKRKIACSSICKSKKKFLSKPLADKRCREINDTGSSLRVYKCNACNGFHLTSKTVSESKSIRKYINNINVMNKLDHEEQIEDEVNYWIKKKGW